MDSPRVREGDTEDVELFQEFIDIKSQSVRNVDSDICPICFDSVKDTQVSVGACVIILFDEVLRIWYFCSASIFVLISIVCTSYASTSMEQKEEDML